ncbi:hypothetical protein [Marinactinospora rubrisoli]|uniref:Uncharacterized protein n=1 Tax=Marinactinospora rubrisoli TaxID=2715399 RepID=A0ABW2KP93_9ACTN
MSDVVQVFAVSGAMTLLLVAHRSLAGLRRRRGVAPLGESQMAALIDERERLNRRDLRLAEDVGQLLAREAGVRELADMHEAGSGDPALIQVRDVAGWIRRSDAVLARERSR